MSLSDAAAVRAMQRNLVAVFDALVRAMPGAESYEGDELCWTLTRVAFAVFNSVFAARLDAATAEEAIEAAKARALRNDVPVLWWTAPGDTPADLAQRLTDAGFAYAATLPGMSLNLSIGLQDGAGAGDLEDVTIAAVNDKRSARAWCDVFAGGFGFPKAIGNEFLPLAIESARDHDSPYRNYLLSWRGEVVATASTMLTEDVAGIYNVATLPHARRRGASVAVLQASEAGLNVYRALGFVERGSSQQFIFTPHERL